MANNNTTERRLRQVHVDTLTERGPSRVHVVHVDTNAKTDRTTERGPTQAHVDKRTRTHVFNRRPSEAGEQDATDTTAYVVDLDELSGDTTVSTQMTMTTSCLGRTRRMQL
eukprot:2239213-Prymnesium_polylepis.2